MADAPRGRNDELDHLDHLARRFEEDARDVRGLARRIRWLRAHRVEGRAWHDAVGSGRTSLLEVVDRTSRRVAEGGASLRRLLIRGLRAEGATMPAIAERLGVSHQRISVLLREDRDPAPREPNVPGV